MKIHGRANRNRSPVGKLTRALTRLLSFRRSSESGNVFFWNIIFITYKLKNKFFDFLKGIKHSIIKFDEDIEEKNSESVNSNLALNKSTLGLKLIF